MLLFKSLFIPLVLTIGIELLVMLVLTGMHSKLLLGVVAVNMATNPVLNFILFILSCYMPVKQTGPIVIVLEIFVVAIEWWLLCGISHESSKKLFLLSLLMNLFSYLIGVIFF